MREQFVEINFRPKSLELIDECNRVCDDYKARRIPLSLRQMYYRLVAQDIIPNNMRQYKSLTSLVTDARMAGLMDWDAIEDRERTCFKYPIVEDHQTAVDECRGGIDLDFWSDQECYVEVWVEKKALENIVGKAAWKWRVPYMATKGYLSTTEAYDAAQRFAEHHGEGRTCVLIHLGDHDPSGIDMTRDNKKRIETLSWGVPIEVRRIALNMDQIEEHRPPPNPAKTTDSRATGYIERFGLSSWELDALDPSIIGDLVEAEIKDLIDPEVWNNTVDREVNENEVLDTLADNWDAVREFLDRLDEEGY